MAGARIKGGGRDERAVEDVLVAVCDLYWDRVHRRMFEKLDGETRALLAAKLTTWARRHAPSADLAGIVGRLQRAGLVTAIIQLESARATSAERVVSVQPTQHGLDRAELVRGTPLGKR